MESNKSALDWLKQELQGFGDPTHLSITWETLDELFEEAIEIDNEIKAKK